MCIIGDNVMLIIMEWMAWFGVGCLMMMVMCFMCVFGFCFVFVMRRDDFVEDTYHFVLPISRVFN